MKKATTADEEKGSYDPQQGDGCICNDNVKLENSQSLQNLVSPAVATEILRKIDPNLTLSCYEARKTTNAGDNYMSEASALKIIGLCSRNGDGKESNNNNNSPSAGVRVIHVFLKQAPLNDSMRKMLIECAGFTKEAQMYTTVFPALGAYFQELIPACYAVSATSANTEDFYLALEDLQLDGYKMPDRQIGLDLEHCKLAISALAKLHALSYVKYRRNYEAIVADYPFLVNHERIFVPEDKVTEYQLAYVSQTGRSYSRALHEAGHDAEGLLLSELFQYPREILKHLHEFTSTPSVCPIISHGDYWINNLLYNYDEQTGKPTHMKFVDFQMVRAGSRTLDLHFLFRTSLHSELTPEMEKKLLGFYHSEFETHSRSLGWFDSEVLTVQQLEDEYEHFLEWGIFVGLFYLQFVHVKPESLQAVDAPPGEDLNENMFNFFYSLLNSTTIEKLRNVIKLQIPRLKQR